MYQTTDFTKVFVVVKYDKTYNYLKSVMPIRASC